MLNSVLAVMLAMSLLGSMRPAMKLSIDLAIGSGRLFLASLAADLIPSVIGFLAFRLKRISGFVGLNAPVLPMADFICVGSKATNSLSPPISATIPSCPLFCDWLINLAFMSLDAPTSTGFTILRNTGYIEDPSGIFTAFGSSPKIDL